MCATNLVFHFQAPRCLRQCVWFSKSFAGRVARFLFRICVVLRSGEYFIRFVSRLKWEPRWLDCPAAMITNVFTQPAQIRRMRNDNSICEVCQEIARVFATMFALVKSRDDDRSSRNSVSCFSVVCISRRAVFCVQCDCLWSSVLVSA